MRVVGGPIVVSAKEYTEDYPLRLEIGEDALLFGFQYGDPLEKLSTPVLTLRGIPPGHDYICASIQHVSGGYVGRLRIRNPGKGAVVRLRLPMTVLDRLEPRAGELAVMARSSPRRQCREDAPVILASFSDSSSELPVSIYALAHIAPDTSASALLVPAPVGAQTVSCDRIERRLDDPRLNPQRYNSICTVSPLQDCRSSAVLRIIVRAEGSRLGAISRDVRGACLGNASAMGGSQ
jgi:hypothetical protein